MTNPMMLNLDDLASAETKTLLIKGTQHKAAELTVQGYIDRVKRAKSIDRDAGPEVQIDETVKMLMDIFPTVTESAWRNMPLRQLNAVIDFALAAPADIASKVESEAASTEGDQGNA